MGVLLAEDAVSATVLRASVPFGQAAPARSIGYFCTVRTAQGGTVEIEIGRPDFEMWPADGPWVYPLAQGSTIFGKRYSTGANESGRYIWQYTETPRMRPCSP